MNWMNTNWKAIALLLLTVYIGWTIYNGIVDNARADRGGPKVYGR